MNVIEEAKSIFDIEIDALSKVRNSINENFVRGIELIHQCEGKIVITGVGKSGLIAKKIAATMSSTGTSCFFLHPAEGLHGDLGIVGRGDIVFIISKSGKSEEILRIIPSLRKIGTKIISMLGDNNSPIAKKSDIVIDVKVDEEACPYNLAPTASTTAALVLGDAIAIVLLKMKNFRPEDFAVFHPGGSLGKRLILTVGDLMHCDKENAILSEEASMENLLIEMTRKALGAVSLVNSEGRLTGIITEGDLRRGLQKFSNIIVRKANEVMTSNPVVSHKDTKAYEALKMMEERKHQIAVLPVTDDDHRPVGMIRLHDLVKAGL